MRYRSPFAVFCVAVVILAVSVGAAAPQAGGSGPFATTAKVAIEDDNGEIALKRPEQIAFMFMSAIANMESDCRHHAGHACTLDELIAGPKDNDNWGIGKLKFDPNKTDPNYEYKVTASGNKWEAWANPRKSGLGGFYVNGAGFIAAHYYKAGGPATAQDRKLASTLVDGDSFKAH